MHEIGVVRQVVHTVEEFAKENNVDKISEIVLDIGEVSMIIPKYVEDVYPAVIKGTILEDAKLIINVVPGIVECEECDEIYNIVEHEGYCPNCGSFEKTVLSGDSFLIREIHIPEE